MDVHDEFCVRQEIIPLEETLVLVGVNAARCMVSRPLWEAAQVPGESREFMGMDEHQWRHVLSTWDQVLRCYDEDGDEVHSVRTPVPAPELPYRPSVGAPAGWSRGEAPEV